jgi:serine/threonine-protein kinase
LPFEIGQTVSDYEILDVLGKGGMGRVYRVRNVISGRIEAMKVLLADFANEPEVGERFGSEIRTLARLDHPNIAKLLTAFRVENEVVMLLEFVEGFTLTDRAKQGLIPPPELQNYISQTLCALAYAHQNGVVHRDIKPSNIMVTPQGVVKLMDFGIAKSQADNLETRAGITMGSVSYMSPEQVRGTAVDARSDVYSMGIVLYELAVGRRPFESESTWAVLESQLNQMPAAPIEANPAISPALNDIILRALQKDPAQRFQSADEFRMHLDALRDGTQLPNTTLGYSPADGTVLRGSPDQPALRTGQSIVRNEPVAGATSAQVLPEPVVTPAPPTRGYTGLIAGAIVLVLVLAAVAGYLWWSKKNAPSTAANATPPAASTSTQRTAQTPANLPTQVHLASGDMVLVGGGEAHLGQNRTLTPVSSFYIDKTEVPLGVYRQFCKEKSIDPPPGMADVSPDMPVTNVTYYEASQFASWAGKRLPTANEWELAARGLNGLSFPWGDTFKPGLANLKDGGSGHLMPIDAYANGASPFGALNMLGNALELVDTECSAPPDMVFEQYRKIYSNLSPPLTPRDPFYQGRGGSYRLAIAPSDLPTLVWDNIPIPARGRQPDVGFRCAKDASASK